MRKLIYLIVVIAPLASAAHAEPLTLSGTIAKRAVLLMLDDSQGKLEGWYLYLRVGKQIRLEGRRDGDTFSLDEFPELGKPKTGRFIGTVGQGRWTGHWQKPSGGAPFPVVLSEESASLSTANANITCRARKADRQFGYTYRYDLSLSLNNGTVAKLAIAQRATSRSGDEQGCMIGLDDLKQAHTNNSLLLRDGADGHKPACSIRLIGAGDYIYVQIGDSSAGGNDCRGGEGVVYCSPRSFWSSMVVGRRNNTCKPVE